MTLNFPTATLQRIFQRLQDIALRLKMPTKESTKAPGQISIVEQMDEMTERIQNWLSEKHEGPSGESEMYQRIESALQRQEGLNRALIKKELQFKEYQKSLQEELSQERMRKQQAQQQLSRYSHQARNHELEIKHLHNERKTLSKESQRANTSRRKDRHASRDINSPITLKQSEGAQEGTPAIGIRAHLRKRSEDDRRRSACQRTRKKSFVGKK